MSFALMRQNQKREDLRHAPLRREIQRLYQEKNGVPAPWDGHTAKVLADWLRVNRGWGLQHILRCVRNRFASDNVNPAEEPVAWIRYLPRYLSPLDKFGKPKRRPNPPDVSNEDYWAERMRQSGIRR